MTARSRCRRALYAEAARCASATLATAKTSQHNLKVDHSGSADDGEDDDQRDRAADHDRQYDAGHAAENGRAGEPQSQREGARRWCGTPDAGRRVVKVEPRLRRHLFTSYPSHLASIAHQALREPG